MTKRDFFILIIKLFGLYSVITTLFSALTVIYSFGSGHVGEIIMAIAGLGMVVGLFSLLTFGAGKLVDILSLDKGFADDRIELGNIKAEDIIKIGTFIIGGLMIVDNIPVFLSQLYWIFKEEISRTDLVPADRYHLGVSGLKVLVGCLLFTNYDFISKRLKGKNQGEA